MTTTKQQKILCYQPQREGNTMERCEECSGHLKQIGHDIFYCDDCDKIVTISNTDTLLTE